MQSTPSGVRPRAPWGRAARAQRLHASKHASYHASDHASVHASLDNDSPSLCAFLPFSPSPPPLGQGRASLPDLAFSTRTYSLFGVPCATHFVSDFLASALPPPPSHHTSFSLFSYPPASTVSVTPPPSGHEPPLRPILGSSGDSDGVLFPPLFACASSTSASTPTSPSSGSALAGDASSTAPTAAPLRGVGCGGQ